MFPAYRSDLVANPVMMMFCIIRGLRQHHIPVQQGSLITLCNTLKQMGKYLKGDFFSGIQLEWPFQLWGKYICRVRIHCLNLQFVSVCIVQFKTFRDMWNTNGDLNIIFFYKNTYTTVTFIECLIMVAISCGTIKFTLTDAYLPKQSVNTF